MTTDPSQFATAAIVLVIVVFIVGRRVVAMVRGTPISPARLFGATALFTALFAVFVAEEFLLLPWFVPVADVGVAVVVAAAASPLVRRRVEVYRDAAGTWHYRLGYAIPVVYLALFGVRLLVDVLVLGVDPFAGPPAPVPLAPLQVLLLSVVDALFAVSMGLLLGRTFGVYSAYRAAVRRDPAARPTH